MRIVCDLDDTLCRAGKDFGNAIPITDVIQRIRKLKNEGHVSRPDSIQGLSTIHQTGKP